MSPLKSPRCLSQVSMCSCLSDESAEISQVSVCSCLSDESAEIPQVSVLLGGTEPCGVVLAGNDGTWEDRHKITLVANQDGRQDGLQHAKADLNVEIWQFDSNTDSWLQIGDTFKLAEFQVHVCVCVCVCLCVCVWPCVAVVSPKARTGNTLSSCNQL